MKWYSVIPWKETLTHRHEWTLNIMLSWKKADTKRQNTIWFHYFFKSIYFESAWVHICTSREGTEREGERNAGRICTVSTEPNVGLDPRNHEITTWAETKRQTLNRLSRAGAPVWSHFYEISTPGKCIEEVNERLPRSWEKWRWAVMTSWSQSFCLGWFKKKVCKYTVVTLWM